MALDLVEFIVRVEDIFELELSDEQIAEISTPRELIRLIESRVPMRDAGPCPTHHTFNRLRESIRRHSGGNLDVAPETSLESLFPDRDLSAWFSVKHDFGATDWPETPSRAASVADLSKKLALDSPPSYLGQNGEWSTSQIRAVVSNLIEDQLAVDMTVFTLDSSFVHEMGFN